VVAEKRQLLDDEFFLQIEQGPPEQTGNAPTQNLRIDLTAGPRVQTHDTGDFLLVFTGYECSNLKQLGSPAIDTLLSQKLEPVLAWLARADGYFSFVLIVKSRMQLRMASDKLGCKTIYYRHEQGRIWIANRLRGVPASKERSLSPEGLHESLHYRWISTRATLVSDVSRVAPCELTVVNLSGEHPQHHRYFDWRSASEPRQARPLEAVVEQLNQAFDDYFSALAPQVSRVLLTLSGGVDSSVVAAKAAEHLGDKLVLALIEFEGDNNPELDNARYYARVLGSETRVIRFCDSDFQDEYREISEQIEQLPRQFSIPAFAKLLNHSDEFDAFLYGEPGDTLYGSATIKRLVKRLGRKRLVARVPSSLLDMAARCLNTNNRRKLRNLREECLHETIFSADRLVYGSADHSLVRELEEHGRPSPFLGQVLELPDESRFLDQGKTNWLPQLKNYMLITDVADHLRTTDMLIDNRSMHILTPLSHLRMLDALKHLRSQDYLGRRQVKVALRELGCRYYDRERMYAPKYGFDTPWERWLDHNREQMVDSLVDGKLMRLGYVNRHNKAALMALSREMLWTLYHLENFVRVFLGTPRDSKNFRALR
jgi:asparagine synthase (glutamine-hydrolysing)